MESVLRVTIWNEGVHEAQNVPTTMQTMYPKGIHGALAEGLRKHLPTNAQIKTVTLADSQQGLSEEVLKNTDVLLWWGHLAHDEVAEENVARVHNHVLAGMGFIALHSAHFSKIFMRLLGTTCSLRWRNSKDKELLWNVNPTHPIAAGVSSPVVIERQEMYGEFFDVPKPDDLVFISSFSGGEVFRSGMTFVRGKGKIFYFSPGDQDYPVYHNVQIQKIIANSVVWVGQTQLVREKFEVANMVAPVW